MRNILQFLACIAAVILFGSGCVFSSREVTVSKDDSLSQRRDYFRSGVTNYDKLSMEAENFLRGNLMLDDFDNNPRAILAKLNEFYRMSGDRKYLMISADLCRYLAARRDESEAIRYHLSSFYYCTAYTREQAKISKTGKNGNALDFSTAQIMLNYNEACCGIFSFLKTRNLLDADAVTMLDAEGKTFVMGKPEYRLSIPSEAIRDFSLCASYTVKDLMQMNRHPGSGIPLVAKIKLKKWYSSLKTPKGLTIPVTLLVKREDNPDGTVQLRLVFIDTSVCEDFTITVEAVKNTRTNLALDFSTPLACFLNELSQRNLLVQMLNPFDQESTDGLYMVEPYNPKKIPVVFIHGLMSSPETWVQMINSLKNDPQIRKRYQFWFFYYSTGAPVIHSAKKLREALFAAQKEFCTTPEATRNFNKMVLAGHSMGGLLTRVMVQQDPHYIFEQLLHTPWEQVKAKLQPEDFKLLEAYSPAPMPFVSRAVFMAVPHRGANMAKSFLGRLGARLIRPPASILRTGDTARRVSKALNVKIPTAGTGGVLTGIDNLDPDNRFVRAVGSSKLRNDLVYHSIIGNRSEDNIPGNSDGIVPYWSSHLDGAASELVVKSDHSVHRRPAAIQEVLRILLIHLKSVDEKPEDAKKL